jgi:hypothetical protein
MHVEDVHDLPSKEVCTKEQLEAAFPEYAYRTASRTFTWCCAGLIPIILHHCSFVILSQMSTEDVHSISGSKKWSVELLGATPAGTLICGADISWAACWSATERSKSREERRDRMNVLYLIYCYV